MYMYACACVRLCCGAVSIAEYWRRAQRKSMAVRGAVWQGWPPAAPSSPSPARVLLPVCVCARARPLYPPARPPRPPHAPMQDPATSEQELEALRSVFALFDTDGTGAIESKEFATILAKVGRDPSEGEALGL